MVNGFEVNLNCAENERNSIFFGLLLYRTMSLLLFIITVFYFVAFHLNVIIQNNKFILE